MKHLIVAISSVVFLGGCDSVARREVIVPGRPVEAERAFARFAAAHQFTCGGVDPTCLRQCRAPGPKFLTLQRTEDRTVIHLERPHPGGRAAVTDEQRRLEDELAASMREP